MAKARARSAARRVKDKWKAKSWYQVMSPTLFDSIPVSETLSEKPENLIGRVTEVSMQDITNDFRKSHIKLFFKIHEIKDGNAMTQFDGHSLTSDYIRRMVRRRKSRIDGVYDIETKDGAYVRVKPFSITDRRIQNSQKKMIRSTMKNTITQEGKVKTLNEFLIDALDGKIGSEIYKNCKSLYPVKRVEIFKTEVLRQPTIQMEEKPKKKEEEKEEPEKKEIESKETKDKKVEEKEKKGKKVTEKKQSKTKKTSTKKKTEKKPKKEKTKKTTKKKK